MFGYKKFLLQVIEDQKQQIKELQARNNQLVDSMVPILRRMNEPKGAQIPLSTEVPQKPNMHKLVYGNSKVTCSCGFEKRSTDTAELQEAASNHHREHTSSLRGGRKSWPQIKNQLEEQSTGGVTQ